MGAYKNPNTPPTKKKNKQGSSLVFRRASQHVFLCFKTNEIFNIYNYLTLFKIKIVRQKCGAINKLAWHNIKPVGKHNSRFKQYHLSAPCEIFRLRLFFG